MCKTRFFSLTAAALFIVGIAGVGGWNASTSQARIAAPMFSGPQINAMQMMTTAANLPAEHFADYSLVYE